ncbi:hypothetical protein ACA097_20835 [Pseudomonas sp. QL9]|uniref:hypothetical protein n=1 Tax=Pseudomonas sp. QL9 TaxID=3242725 RepID=UPI00352B8EAE
MDVRLEAHPHDRQQWRVYLNQQFFFQYSNKLAAQRMFERVRLSLCDVAPPWHKPPSTPVVERRRGSRQYV